MVWKIASIQRRKETIKISHPEHGHVVFSHMSSRQMDLLELCDAVVDTAKKYPNDHDLGREIRRLLNKN